MVRDAKWWKWMIDELTSLTRILASQHKGAGGHWKHWTAWMILWMSRSLWNRAFSSSRTTLVKSVVLPPSLLECNCDPTRSRRRSISSASGEFEIESLEIKCTLGPIQTREVFFRTFPLVLTLCFSDCFWGNRPLVNIREVNNGVVVVLSPKPHSENPPNNPDLPKIDLRERVWERALCLPSTSWSLSWSPTVIKSLLALIFITRLPLHSVSCNISEAPINTIIGAGKMAQHDLRW